MGPIPLAFLVLFKTTIAIRNKIQLGKFINRQKSNVVDENGDLRWLNLVPVLGNFIANTAHVVLFAYSYKYAKLGGLN